MKALPRFRDKLSPLSAINQRILCSSNRPIEEPSDCVSDLWICCPTLSNWRDNLKKSELEEDQLKKNRATYKLPKPSIWDKSQCHLEQKYHIRVNNSIYYSWLAVDLNSAFLNEGWSFVGRRRLSQANQLGGQPLLTGGPESCPPASLTAGSSGGHKWLIQRQRNSPPEEGPWP